MRKVLIMVWLLLPVVAVAYHLGPGQKQMVLDEASLAIRKAEVFSANKKWDLAIAQFEKAQELLPEDRVDEARRLRIEKAKTQMMAAQLPAASNDLKSLVDEMQNVGTTDSKLLSDAQEALANSQYYRTWLMRLEGQPREVWEPEIESSRQIYKLLIEQGENDSKQAKKWTEDLESSIRLARMDLKDLQGLPLPSQ